MPSISLDDRLRELCARAAATNDSDQLSPILAERLDACWMGRSGINTQKAMFGLIFRMQRKRLPLPSPVTNVRRVFADSVKLHAKLLRPRVDF
jgi:hypothetical protein